MFQFVAKIVDQMHRVKTAAEKAAFRNFGHAAATISKDAKESIEKSDGPSPAGTPPHTHQGQYIKRAIRWDADKDSAVIGPLASIVGESAVPHEFGGEYKGEEYPERSFMFPALERAAPRFAGEWQGSIGE